MTARPAGALEACLALLEKATPGEWRYVPWHIEEADAAVRAPDGSLICCTSSDNTSAAIAAAVNYLRQHGPALLAALRLREWRPIAEAPKDGRSVLIFCKDAVIPAIAFFCEDAGSWMSIAGESFAHPIMWVPAPIPTADDLARVLESERNDRQDRCAAGAVEARDG